MNTTRFSEMVKTLEARWKPDWTREVRLHSVARSFRRSLDAVLALQAKAAELRTTGKYSSKGLTEELRSLAASLTVPILKEAADHLNLVKVDLEKQKALLTIPEADPSNTAQAIVRSEMRTWLRSLSGTQAMQVLTGENVDERMLQAAFEAPPIMSGLTAEMRDTLQKELTQRKFGPELTKVADMEEALAQGRAALDISLYQLREEVLFQKDDDAGFNKWMKEATTVIQAQDDAKPVEERLPDLAEQFDEIFARGFPDLYPNHPVNRPLG